MTNEISLILPNFSKAREKKRSIVASLITGFIGLAYEGISISLHNKKQKALYKAFIAMEKEVSLQHNKIIHFKDLIVMYGICNLGTLEKLINTVHKMHNTTTLNEKLFTGKLSTCYTWYLTKDRIGHYAITSLLYLRTLRENMFKCI